MKSSVIRLESVLRPEELRQRGESAGIPTPAFVLAFLPSGPELDERIRPLAEAWPEAEIGGCEAVTQFAEESLHTGGTLLLISFESDASGVSLSTVGVDAAGRPLEADVAAAAVLLGSEVDAAFLVADGVRFPTAELLAELRRRLEPSEARIVGGLASQSVPVSSIGSRVFRGAEILESSCLIVGFRGVAMEVEIVRGWDPASPVYTVTRAEGSVLHEIDGVPATEWYERFFTIDGELSPMPESAYRFPLIVEGPKPERKGLYRSMRSYDDPPGAVTYWGDVEPGDRVRLGLGNDVSLERAASDLAGSWNAEAAVLYSCVGREIVLGDQADREVAAIKEALAGTPLAGFFTFGEIGPSFEGIGLGLHNQTAILALLREAQA